MKRTRFSLVFPTYIQLCTHILVLYFKSLFNSQLFYISQKSHPICSSSAWQTLPKLPTSDQAQQLTTESIIVERSQGFLLTIEKSNYHSIGLCSNIIYHLFVVDRSYKYHSQNISNQ